MKGLMKSILRYICIIIIAVFALPIIIVLIPLVCAVCFIGSLPMLLGYAKDTLSDMHTKKKRKKSSNSYYDDSIKGEMGKFIGAIKGNDTAYNGIKDYLDHKSRIFDQTMNLAQIFFAIVAVISPTILLFTNHIKYYIIVFLAIASIIISLSLTIKGYIHASAYKKFLHKEHISIDQVLDRVKSESEEKHQEIIQLILSGETRNLLIRYPDEYKELKLPHLWSSARNTRIGVYAMLIILSTSSIFLIVLLLPQLSPLP